MELERAAALLQQGGLLVVQDLPVGSEFGLDYQSWTTASRFRGVKMLPPGLHLIYTRYSPAQNDGHRRTRPATATAQCSGRRSTAGRWGRAWGSFAGCSRARYRIPWTHLVFKGTPHNPLHRCCC